MTKMSNKKLLNNGVKETRTEGEGFSPGICPVNRQRRPGSHPATARRKWSKEDK